MSGHDVARQTGFSAGNISRWENGRREIGTVDAATYLATCGVDLAERNRLLDLTEPPSELYWVRPYFHKLADATKSVIIQESLANSITSYEPLVIPGLQQSEAYARAIFEARGAVPRDRISLLVKARMDRQRILTKTGSPRTRFFVHERALGLGIGGPEVMHEQVLQLLLSSAVPTCAIRLVPESAGNFAAVGGAFDVLEFADHPTIVHADTFGAALFMDERPCVEAYYTVVARLEHDALNEGESRARLTQLAGEYEQLKE
ncbi:hypothetical protein HUW46_08150 [Amycolatopsis sp. CA-230715]|nr:hypothetical protein HUW46_08150 [Amycolatopsis sp. CA-230715]